MKKKLLVSVSGGRTSGMMAKLLWDRFKPQYDMVFVFANTSREKEETLVFVNDLTINFGIPIVWLEAVVHHDKRKGCTHKITNFKDAKRKGEIFEDVIKKYGIPNTQFKHCTRELKANPILSYTRETVYEGCIMAIGYRADEKKRVNLVRAKEKNQIYPLYEWGIIKADVAYFWNRQSFDLGIKVDADGNCEGCHKKADLKILYQYKSNPSGMEWIKEMQNKYAYHSAGRKEAKAPFTFFRDNRTLEDIIAEYPEIMELSIDEIIELLNDKSLIEDGANFDLVQQEDCAESCEPF